MGKVCRELGKSLGIGVTASDQQKSGLFRKVDKMTKEQQKIHDALAAISVLSDRHGATFIPNEWLKDGTGGKYGVLLIHDESKAKKSGLIK